LTPLVSVVIPVFNRSAELRRAMESLVRQTASGFEVVVCDDGSTEDIAAVLSPFQVRLPIQYLCIPNSGGPARPRNTAIASARGEWIALLDSDDWWDDNRMEVVLAQLGSDVDLLYHRLRVSSAPGLTRTLEKRPAIGEPLGGNPLKHMALWGNPIPNSSVTVRRSSLLEIGGFSEQPAVVEDFDGWMRLAEAGAQFRYINQVLGTYWVGADGISAFSKLQITQERVLFERHVQHFDPTFRAQAQACHDYRMGAMQLQLGQDIADAYTHLLRATQLPTLSLRMKRWVKLGVARLKMG
jgi:glycosyltransferase involved in cell wall biosynthesis